MLHINAKDVVAFVATCQQGGGADGNIIPNMARIRRAVNESRMRHCVALRLHIMAILRGVITNSYTPESDDGLLLVEMMGGSVNEGTWQMMCIFCSPRSLESPNTGKRRSLGCSALRL